MLKAKLSADEIVKYIQERDDYYTKNFRKAIENGEDDETIQRWVERMRTTTTILNGITEFVDENLG